MISTERNFRYKYSQNEESRLSKIKSFISKHPIIFYGIIGGIILLIIIIIVLFFILTQKDNKEEESQENNNEIKEIKTFPLETSSKNEVMNIYNNIGNKDKSTVEIFCDYLKEKASNLKDEQKVYLAYYWIKKNIEYDYEGLEKGTASTDPSTFFKDRKTVCAGYSDLFFLLLSSMNYPSSKIRSIIGYAKGLGYTPFSPPLPNHKWNAVEINGKWCLIDTTWDAGIDTEYYLCTPPKCFVRDHLPVSDNSLQFLEKPITLEKFHSLIDNSKAFCRYNIEAIEDKAIQNLCGEGKFILKYNYDTDTDMFLSIWPNEKKTPEFFIYKYENRFEVLFYINEKGVYDVHLSMDGYGIGEITFNCDKDPSTKKYYPTLGFLYSLSDTQLLSPIQRDLIQGQRYNFELRSNDYEKMVIIMDDECITMKKNGNIFKEDNVYIHGNNIKIMNEDNYALVTFKGIGNNVDYPVVYYSTRTYNIRLIQPSSKNLYKGQEYEFQIRNESDGTIYISFGSKRIDLDNDNNIFKKSITIDTSITDSKLYIIYKNIEPSYTTVLYEYTLN